MNIKNIIKAIEKEGYVEEKFDKWFKDENEQNYLRIYIGMKMIVFKKKENKKCGREIKNE